MENMVLPAVVSADYINEKSYEPCGSCGEWKVIIWLQMCGRCAVEHRRLTAESVALWKAELEVLKLKQSLGLTGGPK